MTYYTKIFGQLMTVTPVYYEFQDGEHYVYVIGDIADDKVQLVRLSASAIGTHRRAFRRDNTSKQRLGIHFRNTLQPVPESVERVTTIPDINVLVNALDEVKNDK